MLHGVWPDSNFSTTFFTHFVFAFGSANVTVHGQFAPLFTHKLEGFPSTIFSLTLAPSSLGTLISQSAAILERPLSACVFTFCSCTCAFWTGAAIAPMFPAGTAVNIITEASRTLKTFFPFIKVPPSFVLFSVTLFYFPNSPWKNFTIASMIRVKKFPTLSLSTWKSRSPSF